MEKELKEIVLAAWLHDVGKFAQRADRKELYNKDLEGQYCKLQQGGWYSHQHVIYTQGFLEKFKDVLPDEVTVSNVITLAAKHHAPSTYEECIVAQGDRLSSGSDRCNILGEEASEDESLQNDNPKYFEKPLINILSSINLNGKEKGNIAYCPLKPLEDDAVLSKDKNVLSKEKYNELYEQFSKDFAALKGLNYDDFLSSLDSVLERYWWCIPSVTNSDADISLYQHAKTTAAFSAALYHFQKSCGNENETSLNTDAEKKFRFIKGDVSGIQKYIFDLKSNDDSAKLLRAKSFEIAALGESLSRFIVQQFDLPLANIMTSAGGNFMILLPNSQRVKELLPQIQLEIESYFLKEYAGKLSVIISDGVEASSDDIQQKKAQKLINDIGYNADICKQKKMQKALQKNGAVLTEFYDDLQKNGECPKCGVFASSGKNADGTPKECKRCSALTKIGANLTKAAWIKYKTDKLESLQNMVCVSKDRKENSSASVNKFVAKSPVLHLPYTAPRNEDGNLLSFEDIAKKSTGNKKIAMFKADIDNLGLVFSSSLGKRMSFSRYADMSHKLHYFFSAYYTYFVSTHTCIMKDKDGNDKTCFYKDVIYTVFSGGDDLCVLGAWNGVIQFAVDFQKEIVKLTNANPSLTLSAGIVLANSSTPVKMIAESCEEELEKSKHRMTGGTIAKNAVTIFGTTVDWNTFEKCLSDAKKLQGYLENGELTTGVIYKMIDFANRAESVLCHGNVAELLKERTWKSNFQYVVVRNVKNDELKNWLLSFGSSPDEMIKSRIAVSYALYTQRNK